MGTRRRIGPAAAALAWQVIQVPGSISPDGKRVAYFKSAANRTPATQIWTVPVEENGAGLKAGTPEQFLKSQFN